VGWEQAFELHESSMMAKELSLQLLFLKSASLYPTADALPLYHMEVPPHPRKMMSRRRLPQEKKKKIIQLVTCSQKHSRKENH